MRKAFAETLAAAARGDPRVVFLTGDLGYGVFDAFRAEFGARYINAGVAEAQLMSAAAGLALEGWRPVAYSIATFASARPWEQIKIDICYHNLPVVVVGAGGGFTYSNCGITHCASDDLGLMALLPGMTVVAPGGPEELRELLPQMLKLPGPSYLRIGKFGEKDYVAGTAARLGKARIAREGRHVALVTTGDVVSEAVAAWDILKQEGIAPVVCHVHTVKPLDVATMDEMAREIHTVVALEEHLPQGALFAGLCAWRAERRSGPRIVRCGMGDAFVLGSPARDILRSRCGLNAEGIAAACRAAWKERK